MKLLLMLLLGGIMPSFMCFAAESFLPDFTQEPTALTNNRLGNLPNNRLIRNIVKRLDFSSQQAFSATSRAHQAIPRQFTQRILTIPLEQLDFVKRVYNYTKKLTVVVNNPGNSDNTTPKFLQKSHIKTINNHFPEIKILIIKGLRPSDATKRTSSCVTYLSQGYYTAFAPKQATLNLTIIAKTPLAENLEELVLDDANRQGSTLYISTDALNKFTSLKRLTISLYISNIGFDVLAFSNLAEWLEELTLNNNQLLFVAFSTDNLNRFKNLKKLVITDNKRISTEGLKLAA